MKTTSFFYRSEIDGLRAIAVLSVVVFHFFPNLLSMGYLGVDIFFVISGFLVTTQLLKDKNQTIIEQLSKFYIRRIKRLFPALFLFLTLTYFFISVFFLPSDLDSFENSLMATYTFWANFFFWRDGGYFGGNDQLKPLLHMWSLSVEEQFYLFYPLFLLVLLVLNHKIKYTLALVIVFFIVVSFTLWLFLNYIDGGNPAFFLLPTRIWQFGLGAAVAIATEYRLLTPSRIYTNHLLLIISVLFIFIAIFTIIDPQLQTVLVTVGASGFIATSANSNIFLLSFFRSKLCIFFGKISYSMYLYHWPIAVLLSYYFVDKVPISLSLIGVLLSIAAGYVSYNWIEAIFRYQYAFKGTILFLIMCLTATSLIFLSNTNKQNSGLSNTIAKASGTFFKCDISSFKAYGASRACLIKPSNSPNKTIALLGNSHATMYAPLISDASPIDAEVILIPLSGCLPTTSMNLSPKCLAMAKTNLSTVLKDQNVRIVVIGTTWYDDKYFDAAGQEIDRVQLKSAIISLIEEINESGKHAVLFSPIAIPKKDYASELARKLRFNQMTETEVYDIMKFPRKIYQEEFSEINTFFENYLGNAYIKIYNELCDENHCFYGTKNMFYFADDNHLSHYTLKILKKTTMHMRTLLSSLE